MYDVLDLYAEPYDPKRPVVCVDEKPKQLIEDSRTSIPMKLGKPEKYDYEYIRHGKVNIFVAVEPKAGKRMAKVTARRTKQDFAHFIKLVVDEMYTDDVEKIRVVCDNLNTHFENAFYETFDQKEVERLFNKLEFHYTPKHASWLNAAEIEINVMDGECTGRRIKDEEMLIREVEAWENRRNKQKKKIDWRFTRRDADKKLFRHYVS